MPAAAVDGMLRESNRLVDSVHWVRDPELVEHGDEIDGWQVEVLRGHADGHIVLLRDGVLIAGDAILAGITPAIGLYPRSRPDPLGDYFETLARIESLAPRVAYAGHKDPIPAPAGRAREIAAHHVERLARAEARSASGRRAPTRSRWSSSRAICRSSLRRFATAESLAHLERLVREGRAVKAGTSYLAGSDIDSGLTTNRRSE